jgi:pantoate--beta-alanine ligase
MGNLHAGHISLLEEALKMYQTVYFSIFVNPKQFGPTEDFKKYPRTLEQDVALIEKTLAAYPGAQAIIYAPASAGEVFSPEHDQTISVCGLSTILEGKIRPQHFDGVTTVVLRLFELLKPQAAYFGLKDYQQYLVIRQMVQDLVLAVKIQGMPIVREETGLALSSRNQYLSLDQKNASPILFETLLKIKELLNESRENVEVARKFVREATKDTNWNYLELRDADTLCEDISRSSLVTILAAYQMGNTRLLDNMQVELK